MPASNVNISDTLVNQIRAADEERLRVILRDLFIQIRTSVTDVEAAVPAATVSTGSAESGVISYDVGPGPVPFTDAITRTNWVKHGEHVTVLDFGADPSGTEDATVKIRIAIAAVQAAIVAGRTVALVLPPGTYKISEQITIEDTPVVIVADGATLLRADTMPIGDYVLKLDVADCAVVGAKFVSDDVNDTKCMLVNAPAVIERTLQIGFSACITVDGADGTVIRNNRIVQRPAAGPWLPPPPITLASSTGCLVHDNTIKSSGVPYSVEELNGTGTTANVVRKNLMLGSSIEFNPAAGTLSGVLSAVVVLGSLEHNAGPSYARTVIARDNDSVTIVDEVDGDAITLLVLSRLGRLLEGVNVVASGVLGISADDYDDAEANAIPDSVALVRFRPAANAIDISVSSTAGVRNWEELAITGGGGGGTPATPPNVIAISVVDANIDGPDWGPPQGQLQLPPDVTDITKIAIRINTLNGSGAVIDTKVFYEVLAIDFPTASDIIQFGVNVQDRWPRPAIDTFYNVDVVTYNDGVANPNPYTSANFMVEAIDSPSVSTMQCQDLSVNRLASARTADGIETLILELTFKFPVNTDARVVVAMWYNLANGADNNVEWAREDIGAIVGHGGTRTWTLDLGALQAQTVVMQLFTYNENWDITPTPATISYTFIPGTGGLILSRANPSSVGGGLAVVSGQLIVNEVVANKITAGVVNASVLMTNLAVDVNATPIRVQMNGTIGVSVTNSSTAFPSTVTLTNGYVQVTAAGLTANLTASGIQFNKFDGTTIVGGTTTAIAVYNTFAQGILILPSGISSTSSGIVLNAGNFGQVIRANRFRFSSSAALSTSTPLSSMRVDYLIVAEDDAGFTRGYIPILN